MAAGEASGYIAGQDKQNALHHPGKRVVINGNNISIDKDHRDEGVWLEDSGGNIVEKGIVIRSDSATCHVKFNKLPKKKGAYNFVLSCRDGRGCDFEPKRVSRRVTVR